MINQVTVFENPRPREAVSYVSDHGYANDSEFLFAVARWIVEQGGAVTLTTLEDEAIVDAPAPFELHVHDLDSQDSSVFEPMDTLIHFGHGVFAVVGADYFGEAYTVGRHIAAVDPLDVAAWAKVDPAPWVIPGHRSSMIFDPPKDIPSDAWLRLMENAREFIGEAVTESPVDTPEQEPDPVAEVVEESAPYMATEWPGIKEGSRVGVDIDGSVFIGVARYTDEGLVLEGIPDEAAEPAVEEAGPAPVHGMPCGAFSMQAGAGHWCDLITGHEGMHSWKTNTSAVDDQAAADLAYGRANDSATTPATGTGDA